MATAASETTVQNHIEDFSYVTNLASQLKEAYAGRISMVEYEDWSEHKRYNLVKSDYGNFPRWKDVEELLNEAHGQLEPESGMRWNMLDFYDALRKALLKTGDSGGGKHISPKIRNQIREILDTAEAWEMEWWP